MMKKILLLAAFAALFFDASAQQKEILPDEVILEGRYDNIILPTPVPSHFGKDTLYYTQGADTYAFVEKDGIAARCRSSRKSKVGNEELVKGWVNPTPSPDGQRIAYTKDNDLYSIELATGNIVRHTFDGSDVILNGYASWVYYEEIFGRPSKYKAFWWSPDSKVIAYYRFDNTDVPMFPIYNSEGQHGSINRTRYPKAGDPNPKVKVGFVSIKGGDTVWADFDQFKDQYFGTPFWNGDGTKLMVSWMSRSQDDFELFSVTPSEGRIESVYKEHQKSWIDWMDGMLFTKEGIYIVRDYTGWQQIYFLSYDGKQFQQLSDGHNWGVSLLKADRHFLFFTAKRECTTRTDIYRLNLRNKAIERVSFGDYNFSNVVISEDGKHIAAVASNARTPFFLVDIIIPSAGGMDKKQTLTVASAKGPDFNKYEIALPQMMELTMRDGVKIPASVVWPIGMDKSRKYPVKVNIYGGPDSPQVNDRWSAMSKQWWAAHGVIQVTLDNRAGGHLGKAGIEQVYRHLADIEIDDFIDGIKCFRALPYVNCDKIGIEGFSFGGTMTTLCVTEGCEYFKYGIAGGGVYDWALYDTHYTERYMDTPRDNPDGYSSTRVMERVSNSLYKGDRTNMLRITHGTGDDNVHFQNTLQLIDRMQKDCKDFELMIYPQGMHGYRGLQGRHSSMQDYKFWYRYLLDTDLPRSILEHFGR